MPFLAPLEDVEFDEYESHQPQECVPEVDKIAFDTPESCRKKQACVKNDLKRIADPEGGALQSIAFLQPHVNFEYQNDQQPYSGVDDVDPPWNSRLLLMLKC